MNNPWLPLWFGGALGGGVGLLGAIYGSLVGFAAPRGKWKRGIFAYHYSQLVLGVVSLVMAIIAFTAGQPYGVWYPFGLCGILLTIMMSAFTPMLKLRYREAEERRMIAHDLSAE